MSRKTRLLAFVLMAGLVAPAAQQAHAVTGSILATYVGPCGSGNGRAVLYLDGVLYYTVFTGAPEIRMADPTTGACLGRIPTARYYAALTYDPTRDTIWAGAYDGTGKIYTIDRTTGAQTFQFDTLSPTGGDGSCCPGYVDGLSYDPVSDSLWFSNDLSFGSSQKIFRFSTTGTVLQSFTVAGGNSGIAYDGKVLWLGFPLVPEIRRYATTWTGGAMATPISTFGTAGYLTEGMTFDSETFAPKCAVWINGATFGSNPLVAFETDCPPMAPADAYSVNLSVEGVAQPVHVRALGDARVDEFGGSASNTVQIVTLPMGLGTVEIGRNEAEGTVPPGLGGDASSRAQATIAKASLLGGAIEAEAITSVSASAVGGGSASSSASGSEIASLTVNGTPVSTGPGPSVTIPVPGVGSLALFEQVPGGNGTTKSELEVRALHLAGTVGGASIDLIVAAAYSGASTAGRMTPRPPASPPIEPEPSADDIPPLPPVPVPALGPTFEDGFESGQGSWTTTGTAGLWEFGAPTSGPGAAHGGSNVAATKLAGSYANSVNGRLGSPTIDLTGFDPSSPLFSGKTAKLRFWSWFSSESYYDCGVVQVSTDAGATWTKITPAEGYSYTSFASCGGLAQTGSFSGSSGATWKQYTLDLTAFGTEEVRLGLAFASDSSVTAPGWYVDDFKLTIE